MPRLRDSIPGMLPGGGGCAAPACVGGGSGDLYVDLPPPMFWKARGKKDEEANLQEDLAWLS